MRCGGHVWRGAGAAPEYVNPSLSFWLYFPRESRQAEEFSMTDLSIDLMTPEGRSAFNDALASLIRSDRHGEADAILARHFAAVPSEFSALARALPAEAVSITGWEAFNTRIEVVSLGGDPVTAVGIDITDQGDATDEQGRREQLLELGYYTDESGFRFSGATRESLLAASSGASTAPWVGCFAEIDGSVAAKGLAPLCDALLNRPERVWSYMTTDAERRENLGAFLAGWLRHLRVHQGVKRHLERARPRPKRPGDRRHQRGPALFHRNLLSGQARGLSAAAEQSRAASERGHRAAYAEHTEEQIARWREQREGIRSWSPQVNPDKRRTYVDSWKRPRRRSGVGTPLVASAPATRSPTRSSSDDPDLSPSPRPERAAPASRSARERPAPRVRLRAQGTVSDIAAPTG